MPVYNFQNKKTVKETFFREWNIPIINGIDILAGTSAYDLSENTHAANLSLRSCCDVMSGLNCWPF